MSVRKSRNSNVRLRLELPSDRAQTSAKHVSSDLQKTIFSKKLGGNIFFEQFDPYETGANPTQSTQNLTPGRFWHAEAESDVKTLRIPHRDLEMKEVWTIWGYFGDLF